MAFHIDPLGIPVDLTQQVGVDYADLCEVIAKACKWDIVREMGQWDGPAGVDLRYWAPSVVEAAEQEYRARHEGAQP